MKNITKKLFLCLSLATINITQINAISLKSLVVSTLAFSASAQTNPTNCPTAVPSAQQNNTNNYPTPAPTARAARCPACDRSSGIPTAVTGARILRQMAAEQKGL
jgi:hypothetical protein